MSNLQQDIKSLETVTLNRLLFINKTIRENRNKNNGIVNLAELKLRRKETDQLLSKIKHIGTDEYKYKMLKAEYMTT